MIDQIEFVSHHFNYSEEYVLEHTPDWIERKYIHAMKNLHEQHRMNILTGFKSISLFLDTAFNKGAMAAEILPPPFDTLLKQNSHEKEQKSNYIEGQWWIKK